jgi:aconitase B
VAYVGDVVGTGSSRKSAINSVLWHTGNDIPHVPNKRSRRSGHWRQDRADLLQHC